MASSILLYNNISRFCKGVTDVYTLTYTGNSGYIYLAVWRAEIDILAATDQLERNKMTGFPGRLLVLLLIVLPSTLTVVGNGKTF